MNWKELFIFSLLTICIININCFIQKYVGNTDYYYVELSRIISDYPKKNEYKKEWEAIQKIGTIEQNIDNIHAVIIHSNDAKIKKFATRFHKRTEDDPLFVDKEITKLKDKDYFGLYNENREVYNITIEDWGNYDKKEFEEYGEILTYSLAIHNESDKTIHLRMLLTEEGYQKTSQNPIIKEIIIPQEEFWNHDDDLMMRIE